MPEQEFLGLIPISATHCSFFMGPRPLGPKEIDRLLVPPGKAYTLLTDHLIAG